MAPLAAAARTLILASVAAVHAVRADPMRCESGEHGFLHKDTLLCHHLTPALPFAEALASCRSSGGRLVTVLSADHNAFLYSLLTRSSFIGAVQRQRLVRHPRRQEPVAVWAWLSGHKAEYVNVLDKETKGFYHQPDGGGFEGCMELMKHAVLEEDPGNGRWGDTDCRASKPAICVRTVKNNDIQRGKQLPKAEVPRKSPVTSRWALGSCTDGLRLEAVSRLGEPWHHPGRSVCLSALQTAAGYDDALRQCQRLHVGAVVWQAARQQRMRVRPPLPGLPGRLWTGADRRGPLLRWRWQDGSEVPRRAWAAGQPRDQLDLDCAAFDVSSGGLVATSCHQTLPYLCEAPASGCLSGFVLDGTGTGCVRDWRRTCFGLADDFTTHPAKTHVSMSACGTTLCQAACPLGTTPHAGVCYTVHDEVMTMEEAHTLCNITEGLQVASAANSEQNEFLRRQAVRLRTPVWTVPTDSFSNYHKYVPYGLPDEPNEGPGSCTIVWYDGEWMDVPCDEKFAVVCALPIRRPDCFRAGDV